MHTLLAQARIKELLSYDDESGILTWIKSTSNRVKVGSIAGCIRPDGYCVISIDSVKYQLHRVVWLYVYGEMPTLFIDHMDGNTSNNRIINLRQATQTQNLHNMRKNKLNTSGFKGVHFHKGSNKWRAVASVGNHPKHIGVFKTPEEASHAYQAWCTDNRGAYAWVGV